MENSKELCATASGVDPVECGSGDPPISGGASGEAVNSGKEEAALAAPVSAPTADGCCLYFCCFLCMFKSVDCGFGEFEFFKFFLFGLKGLRRLWWISRGVLSRAGVFIRSRTMRLRCRGVIFFPNFHRYIIIRL